MWEPTVEHPLRRLFAGLAEHAFLSHLGVADPPLIDYLSSLLSRFVHTDAVFRLRGGAGQPLTELVEMVIEAEQLPRVEQFAVAVVAPPMQSFRFVTLGDGVLRDKSGSNVSQPLRSVLKMSK